MNQVIDIKRVRELAKKSPRKQSSTDRLRRWLDRVEPELDQLVDRDQLRRIIRQRYYRMGTIPTGDPGERNRVRVSKERRKLNDRLARVVAIIRRLLVLSDCENVGTGLELTE